MNFLNPEPHLKDTESAIKNKLIDVLSQLRGFIFLTTLILEFKKIENDDKAIYTTFYLNSKAGKVILMMYLSQAVALLYQTYKNL